MPSKVDMAFVSTDPDFSVLSLLGIQCESRDMDRHDMDANGDSASEAGTIDFIDPDDFVQESPARAEWLRYKEEHRIANSYLERVMEFPGLEEMKQFLLNTLKRVTRRTTISLSVPEEIFDCMIIGQPESDSLALARLYVHFLASLEVISLRETFILDGAKVRCNSKHCCIKAQLQDNSLRCSPEKDSHHTVATPFIDEGLQQSPSPVSSTACPTYKCKCLVVYNFYQHCTHTDDIYAHLPDDHIFSSQRHPIIIFQGETLRRDESTSEESDSHVSDSDKSDNSKSQNGKFGITRSGFGDISGDIYLLHTIRVNGFKLDERVALAKAMFQKRAGGRLMYAANIDISIWRAFVTPNTIQSGLGTSELEWLRLSVKKALRRQKNRITHDHCNGIPLSNQREYPLTLNKTDLLGLPFLVSLQESPSWSLLGKLFGATISRIKDDIISVVDHENRNRLRKRSGQAPLPRSYHRAFIGSAGSGKTTAANLYAQTLVELGIISRSGVVRISATESQLHHKLNQADCAVFILDDLHKIDSKRRQGFLEESIKKVRRSGCNEGKDICLLVVGQLDCLEDLYRTDGDINDTIYLQEETFHFCDLTLQELYQVFQTTAEQHGLSIGGETKVVLFEALEKLKRNPRFHNGSGVVALAERAISRYDKRSSSTAVVGTKKAATVAADDKSLSKPNILEPDDIDPAFGDKSTIPTESTSTFKDFIDLSSVKERFEDYRLIVSGFRRRGKDPTPYIPFTFIFQGPPGTGKTTSARKLGQFFYDLDILSSAEVLECSATDLIGEYVGQTGPKVQDLLERALGRVLFIDEAYRLAEKDEGTRCNVFAREAVGELVDALTKPRFARKLIVILAGYEKEMIGLLRSNPGLRSRFPTQISFKPLSIDGCIKYLLRYLAKAEIKVLDVNTNQPTWEIDGDLPLSKLRSTKIAIIKLSSIRDWANARSIEALGDRVIGEVYKQSVLDMNDIAPLIITTEELGKLLDINLQEQALQR